MTRVLFVGEAWQGSNARSLREALAKLKDVSVWDLAEDAFLPKFDSAVLRLSNRLLRTRQVAELASAIRRVEEVCKPHVMVVYKGIGVRATLIEELKARRVYTVNIFPDYSPHAYGRQLQRAVGCYDLVVSAKPFHERLWKSVYGYDNRCAFVPHGYDPEVHYSPGCPEEGQVDVALCATWRPEYHELMLAFAEQTADLQLSVSVAGPGWNRRRADFPSRWRFVGPKFSHSYAAFLRSAKIVIAPLNRRVLISGIVQPGDEDSARTYELAAANCFFVHQRSNYVATVYDERTEVPMWSDAAELSVLVRRWLNDGEGRRRMARRAHERAVPSYSLQQRAFDVLRHVREALQSVAEGECP